MNAFCGDDETPYCIYTSKQTFEKHVHLLLLQNSKNSQYTLIKDFLSKVLECIHNPFITYDNFEFTFIPSTGHVEVGNAKQ